MGSSLSSPSLLELEAIVAQERAPIQATVDTLNCLDIAGLVGLGWMGMVGGSAIFADVKSHQVQENRDCNTI